MERVAVLTDLPDAKVHWIPNRSPLPDISFSASFDQPDDPDYVVFHSHVRFPAEFSIGDFLLMEEGRVWLIYSVPEDKFVAGVRFGDVLYDEPIVTERRSYAVVESNVSDGAESS